MSAQVREGPLIVELDGPPTPFFEIPLDYWANSNGELEAEDHPDVARLVQRVVYINFNVADALGVRVVTDRVNAKLKELGGGYIWWNLRPTMSREKRMRLRLGTTPQLATAWWQRLSDDV